MVVFGSLGQIGQSFDWTSILAALITVLVGKIGADYLRTYRLRKYSKKRDELTDQKSELDVLEAMWSRLDKVQQANATLDEKLVIANNKINDQADQILSLQRENKHQAEDAVAMHEELKRKDLEIASLRRQMSDAQAQITKQGMHNG